VDKEGGREVGGKRVRGEIEGESKELGGRWKEEGGR
jgi:hypothetical protein